MDKFPFSQDSGSLDVSLSRLNTEWSVLIALREVVGIALKGEVQPTYSQVLALAQKLFPQLFNPKESLLIRQRESDITREYRQQAEAEAELQKKPITPLELVEADIQKFENLVNTRVETDKLRVRLSKLHLARQELKQTEYSEQQLILRDALRTDREYPISGTGKDYREFQLARDRVLRIRVLHPDQPEHLMGADVIYENYWDERRVVRMAAIQYKVWEDKILYSDERMEKQLERLECTFCKSDLCKPPEDNGLSKRYRLPYCAAFLRPTDKLQSTDSRFISTGYHVPICVVARSWEEGPRGGKRIVSKNIRSEAVTHKIFEELFNSKMLGSRFIPYERLEELYRQMKILDADERIVIHAQEFGRN